MSFNEVPATTLAKTDKNAVRASNRFRLHLYNGKITDWFDHDDLTQMMKKYEGRIVAVAKE